MRKRSKYRPKGVMLDTMSWVKSGFAKVADIPKAGVELKIKNHEALDSVLMGTATRDHIDVLIAAFNMAEAFYMVNPKLGSDWKQEIKNAQDAIFTMSRRGLSVGRFLFTGPEMQAVKLGMDIHDAQLDDAQVRELERALDIVADAIKNKKARPIVEPPDKNLIKYYKFLEQQT